jgi:hypothetical protein
VILGIQVYLHNILIPFFSLLLELLIATWNCVCNNPNFIIVFFLNNKKNDQVTEYNFKSVGFVKSFIHNRKGGILIIDPNC